MPVVSTPRIHLTCACADEELVYFIEFTQLFFFGLKRAGADISWQPRALEHTAQNLILAAHHASHEFAQNLPANSIIVNLEQLSPSSAFWRENATVYSALLQKFPVLDYSPKNVNWLREQLGVHAEIMTFGYVPELERIQRQQTEDIDVLFFGSLTPRRIKILDALANAGIKLSVLGQNGEGLFGAERDAIIARSKVVLNLHAYDTHIFEQGRVNYLAINGKAIVSEVLPDTEIPDLYREVVVAADGIPAIIAHCKALIADSDLRSKQETKARETMRLYPQEKLLQSLSIFAGLG